MTPHRDAHGCSLHPDHWPSRDRGGYYAVWTLPALGDVCLDAFPAGWECIQLLHHSSGPRCTAQLQLLRSLQSSSPRLCSLHSSSPRLCSLVSSSLRLCSPKLTFAANRLPALILCALCPLLQARVCPRRSSFRNLPQRARVYPGPDFDGGRHPRRLLAAPPLGASAGSHHAGASAGRPTPPRRVRSATCKAALAVPAPPSHPHPDPHPHARRCRL